MGKVRKKNKANGKKSNKNKKRKRRLRKPIQKKAQKKQKKKRDSSNFPGLNKHLFSRIKQEQHDYDYIDQLNDKEKAWLSKFTEEFLGARLNGEGKTFHKTKKLRKDCFDRNNARNRDIVSIATATGTLDRVDSVAAILEEQQTNMDYEDKLIDFLDDKKSGDTE